MWLALPRRGCGWTIAIIGSLVASLAVATVIGDCSGISDSAGAFSPIPDNICQPLLPVIPRAYSQPVSPAVPPKSLPSPTVVSPERAFVRVLNATAQRVPDVPSGLEKYLDYDASSRRALRDLTHWLIVNRVSLPLFTDMLSLPSSSPRVFVGILTARRMHSPLWNLVQTVTSMLTRMGEYSKVASHISIHVFNVDTYPDQHSEVSLIEHLVPVTTLTASVQVAALHMKETLDYLNVLRLLQGRDDVSFPIIVEDDVVADMRWVELVDQAIELVKKYGNKWFAVRLYVARERRVEVRTPKISAYNQGFNSVAVMFNPRHLPEFTAFADREVAPRLMTASAGDVSMNIDHVMEAYAARAGLPIKSFEPVVFQHVGIFSSVTQRDVSAEGAELWYMQSKNFNSEGIPIFFDKSNWATRKNTRNTSR